MVVFALTLIRHGETTHNRDNVIQGQLDVPLSQIGFQQAELLGSHLQYQQYSHAYASDLKRAIQTAESIIHQNKSFKSSLLHDRRLRERKFGAVEGKSFKYLKEAAEKSNQHAGHYTPPGGETIQQVHERAVSFFQDLCKMVKEGNKIESSNDAAIGQINLNGSLQNENGNHTGQKRKWESDSVQNLECQSGSINKVCIKELHKNENQEVSELLKSGPGESSICDDTCKVENGSTDDVSMNGGKCSHAKTDKQIVGCKKNYSENVSERGQFSIMFTDEDIRSQIISSSSDMPNIECPNVSLSPLVDQNYIASPLFCCSSQENSDDGMQNERRLSVCSSCDDADSAPTLMANILVVSHGGWLRELLRHFVEDLECSVPGGRKQALRISPNAGLSKFTVSLEDHDGHPKIICLQIHDKQHLISTNAEKSISYDDIAL